MSIERNFDIAFVAALALREKQIQQVYRPTIAIHKWFARRPGTAFRSLLLSEFAAPPLREAFVRAHNLSGRWVADPFMGGGTPLIEANRVGCDIAGCDINPMAYWIVRQTIEHLDLAKYRHACEALSGRLEKRLGALYRTRCVKCGAPDASAKSFLWVKTQSCGKCGHDNSLFPGRLVADDQRHPHPVVLCPRCAELEEILSKTSPGHCSHCGEQLDLRGTALRNRFECVVCNAPNRYPEPSAGPPRHRMFAIEYFCRGCRGAHAGRFFKKPDAEDLDRYAASGLQLAHADQSLIPDDAIPDGVETERLHRWGYSRYREMFNDRQLLGLSFLGDQILLESDERVRNALATNLSDLLRYQNMLCRYDTVALKSLDVFSVHGFPVGLVQCESNLLGIQGLTGQNVGSGGWSNITAKYLEAKRYCEQPFEVSQHEFRKQRLPIRGEWIGDGPNPAVSDSARREVRIECRSALELTFPPGSLDAVFTDPPYFANVQYAELMDFCYVWLRRLMRGVPPFDKPSTRHEEELTGNAVMGRGLEHFTQGLSAVLANMAAALKPGSPLAFTYHHNRIDAYYPIAVAILDSGLACSASLPCPGEMGGSIHISGTGSSIIDTVFVCRSTGAVLKRWILDTLADLRRMVGEDVDALKRGGVKPTQGDIRCITYGHLVRMCVWRLRSCWQRSDAVETKLKRVTSEIGRWGMNDGIWRALEDVLESAPALQLMPAQEEADVYATGNDETTF